MSRKKDGQALGKYTLEFKLKAVRLVRGGQGWSGSPCHTLKYKLKAVRLVKGGQVAAVTAKILGILEQTIENWVRLAHKSQHRSL